MTIEQIKKQMLAYIDFYGGDIPCIDKIKAAKTKKELKQILWEHEQLMESMLADARSHLNNFERKLGLHKIY